MDIYISWLTNSSFPLTHGFVLYSFRKKCCRTQIVLKNPYIKPKTSIKGITHNYLSKKIVTSLQWLTCLLYEYLLLSKSSFVVLPSIVIRSSTFVQIAGFRSSVFYTYFLMGIINLVILNNLLVKLKNLFPFGRSDFFYFSLYINNVKISKIKLTYLLNPYYCDHDYFLG